MKTLSLFLLLVATGSPALAQQRLRYTLWADGLINPQVPTSNLYFIGTGLRGEVSKPLRNATRAWFAQVGYAHFFQKNTGAFTVNVGLLNVGYRYQSRRAFGASVGVGAQYWSERMRVRFADGAVAETFRNVLPSATAGIGFRIRARYRLGLENRVLVKPEASAVVLRNNVALSVGYTF